MTSSSTVGTGRRYRLRPDLLTALSGDLPSQHESEAGFVRLVAGIENVVIHVPRSLTEPVGLDMAEPPDGTVVRVMWREGSMPVVAERDDKGATEADERWHGADGLHYRWHEFAHAASITVLEPRDDTLHAALTALHADLAAKAETLQRVAAGTGYAYCRDALGKLLAVDGFHINGREEKPETVTFPWELTNISGYRDRFAKVEPLTSSVSVAMGDDQGSYVVLPTPDEARAMAAAILAAADIAETWPRTRRATDATT